MRPFLVPIFAALILSGCAGLNTAWVLQLQMRYETPQEKPVALPTKPEKGS